MKNELLNKDTEGYNRKKSETNTGTCRMEGKEREACRMEGKERGKARKGKAEDYERK